MYPTSGNQLFSKDPFKNAKIRHCYKIFCGGNGVEMMYSLLKNQDPSHDQEKVDKLYGTLEKFSNMADPEGKT